MTFLEALRFMEDHPGREVVNSDDEGWRFNRTLQCFERRSGSGAWLHTDVSLKEAARLHTLEWRTAPSSVQELASEWRAFADRIRAEWSPESGVTPKEWAGAYDKCADQLLELDKRVRP